MSLVYVNVKPELLRWARERADLSVDAVAEKVHEKYPLWETGQAQPTLRQLETFAEKVHVPFGSLFLEAAPVEALPIEDFRTASGKPPHKPSVDLLETIRTMQARQDWMREYLLENDAEPLSFVGALDVSVSTVEAAAFVRATIGLEQGWAAPVVNWERAFSALQGKIEALDVMVVLTGYVGNQTRRKLSEREFRGFVLADAYAPLIFVNGADAKSAQMFTLIHEFVHLTLNRSGVVALPITTAPAHEVERFCDAVAAETLVPQAELNRAWARASHTPAPFLTLAKQFKVSPLVIARRAFDLGMVSKEQFFGFYNRQIASDKKAKDKQKEKGGGGDYYVLLDNRISRLFATTIAHAAHAGEVLFRDAYYLTGLHGKTFVQYAEKLGVR